MNALGIFLIGLALASRAVGKLGLPGLGKWGDAVTIAGLALVLAGLIDWRRLLTRLVR
jgi:hypothetical protein